MRSSSAHVFVDDLDAPAVSDDDRHHLARVLRLRAGETVSVSDGRGGWRLCTWTDDSAPAPVGDVVREPAPHPPVTVAVPLLKGDRTEWTVQKLTEVGVDRIVPFVPGRAVVRSRNLERLRRVAREAAMQSRRAWLPEVVEPVAFAEAAALPGAALAEPGGDPPSLERPTVLVGPEGGWTPEERACGLPAVGLGPTVLRAETAAVVAAALLCGLRAGLVIPPPGKIST
ncbi:MAG TPA: RsmE family RNA methyltransferase [Acidimicrobiales bacterium]|nr:RsmE family RNA methyltransferase [Acidimicrobiales bacterium]